MACALRRDPLVELHGEIPQATAELVERIDENVDSGSGLASLCRALREIMQGLSEPTPHAPDLIDELRLARQKRLDALK